MEHIMQDKVNDLEKGLIRLEGTMKNFSAVMSDKLGMLTTSMEAMSNAVQSIAVAEVRVGQLEDDVKNIANNHRTDIGDIYEKLNKVSHKVEQISGEHYVSCDKKCEELDEKSDARGSSRMKFGLAISLGALGSVASYFYLDMVSIKDMLGKNNIIYTKKLEDIVTGIHGNQLILKDNKTSIELLSKDMFYIKKEQKEWKDNLK